jgi:hypothetical protein
MEALQAMAAGLMRRTINPAKQDEKREDVAARLRQRCLLLKRRTASRGCIQKENLRDRFVLMRAPVRRSFPARK